VTTSVESPHYATVLVPLDGSHRAAEALPRAAEVARANVATIVLLHVLASGERTPERESRRMQMEAYLQGLRRLLAADGLKVAWLIDEGSPAETIAGVARTLASPLVVVSRAGYTASAGDPHSEGRVAEEVGRLWGGPTLVI
jgi:nucleotide-binding universal stress UspA family protein